MRRYIITLIPVIILILFSSFDALGQTSKDLDRLYKQGQDLYKKVGSRADMEKAVQKLEQALVVSRKLGEEKGESNCLNEIGYIYYSWGQYTKALEYYEKSLEISRKIGDMKGEGVILHNIGYIYYSWGQYTKALEYYEKSMEFTRKDGELKGEGVILNSIGNIYNSLGQYTKALEYYEKSLEISRKIGYDEGTSLGNIGKVYYSLGQYTKALEYYEKALKIKQSIGVPTDRIRSGIGHIYLDMGQIEEAEPFIRASEKDAALGRLHLMKSEYSEAQKHYEELLKKAEENHDTDDLFTAYTGLGRVFEAKEDYSKAAEYYEKAVNTVEDVRLGVSPSERKDFFTVKIGGFPRSDSVDGLTRVRMKINKASGSIDSSTKKCAFKIDISGKYPDLGCKDVTDMYTFLNSLLVDDSEESFNKMLRELVSSKKCDFRITGDRVTVVKRTRKA